MDIDEFNVFISIEGSLHEISESLKQLNRNILKLEETMSGLGVTDV